MDMIVLVLLERNIGILKQVWTIF